MVVVGGRLYPAYPGTSCGYWKRVESSKALVLSLALLHLPCELAISFLSEQTTASNKGMTQRATATAGTPRGAHEG